MKRATAPAAAGVLAGLLLLCCACGAPDAGSAENTPPLTEQSGEPFRSTQRTGRTAVLMEPAALTHCFSYTYRDADDPSTYRWVDWDEAQPYALRPGDLVLVLEEAGGTGIGLLSAPMSAAGMASGSPPAN